MPQQVGMFYIDYREVTSITPDSEWNTDVGNARYVIKGGISHDRAQGGNYFSTYFQDYKPYLTWQLSGRLCGLMERMYLFMLMPRPANGTVNVHVTVVYTDGSQDNSLSLQLPAGAGKYSVYAIPSGAQQLNISNIQPDKRLYFYEIYVEDASGVLANPFRYVIDYRNSYNKEYFNFTNSLGGMDSIRILGEIEPSVDRETESAQVTATANGREGNQVIPMEFASTIILTNTFKGNAGFVGKKEQHYLTELFYSRSCWQIRFERWSPILITSKTLALAKSGDDLFSLPIEWEHGFQNSQFMPDFAPCNRQLLALLLLIHK